MPRTTDPSSRLPFERLRVGDCEVDIPLREIHAPGARRPARITPKTMGVLLVLAEQAGRVVSRDTLLARVWPDTLPTNDVVTQAVTQLRKAFGADRSAARYIETIAKTGYRLLVPVEWFGAPVDTARLTSELPAIVPQPPVHDTAGAGSPIAVSDMPGPDRPIEPAAIPRPASRGIRPALLGAITLAVVLVALAAMWVVRRDAAPDAAPGPTSASPPYGAVLPTPDFRLITSAPGYEGAPSLSPDGALVAYVAAPAGGAGAAVMVQTTEPSTPRRLTTPPAGAEDRTPAWSPDGRDIAFVRTRGADCAVMVVPVTGGDAREVGRCDGRNPPTFDWTPDGRSLLFGSRGIPGDGAGMRLLHLASGRWSRLDYLARADDIDAMPHYSPDGRWIVFVRNAPVGDFWRLPATGGTATQLTRLRADLGGWDFAPDGRSLVFARWRDSESRLYRLDLDSGVVREFAVADGGQPAIAARAPALAFSQQRNYFGLYRFELPGGRARRLFPSSGRDRLPTIAPDGHHIAFASDRSGHFGLWWADLRRPESLRLIEGVLPESRHLPAWSPDSTRLLLIGTGRDGVTGLHEVAPAAGRVTRLPLPAGDPVQAVYLPGAEPRGRERLLVVAGADDGRLGLTLYDRRTQPWRALGSIDDVALVRVDDSGERILFTRNGRAGLWQADRTLSPASVRQVDPGLPLASRYRLWNLAADGSLFRIDRVAGCAAQLQAPPPAAPTCLDRERIAAVNGFSVAPDASAVYVSISESLGGDIGFLTLPMVPEALWPGVGK